MRYMYQYTTGRNVFRCLQIVSLPTAGSLYRLSPKFLFLNRYRESQWCYRLSHVHLESGHLCRGGVIAVSVLVWHHEQHSASKQSPVL